MKTIVLANQKGGVGKSAIATLLAHYFVAKGQRVLAIDLDHQGNFGTPLAASKRATAASCRSDRLMTHVGVELPDRPFVAVAAGDGLLVLERQPDLHNAFAGNFRAFLARADDAFDVCVVDTNPNPDVRLTSALVSADFVLSPLQLNQEAVDGVRELLGHPRVGVQRIKAVLNPKLHFIGLLPTLVEGTPFQRANLIQVVQAYGHLLIQIGSLPGQCALLPKRSAIAEAQASGEILWEMKKTAARDAWRQIEPSIARIAAIVLARQEAHAAAN